MSNRTIQVNDRLYEYLLDNSLREADILRQLREETARLGDIKRMQIAPEQGQFMALIAELMGAGEERPRFGQCRQLEHGRSIAVAQFVEGESCRWWRGSFGDHLHARRLPEDAQRCGKRRQLGLDQADHLAFGDQCGEPLRLALGRRGEQPDRRIEAQRPFVADREGPLPGAQRRPDRPVERMRQS